MEYCLAIGLHNLYFNIALVNKDHEIVKLYRCNYDTSKDIARCFYLAYLKYFSKYKVSFVGVSVSNNMIFRDGFIEKTTLFSLARYDLKQALYKLFKVDIYIEEETYLASLAFSYKENIRSLLYVILDNKISNSYVIDHSLVELEDDIDLRKNLELNEKCNKEALKSNFLCAGYDDEYLGVYFLSSDNKYKNIISDWAHSIDKALLSLNEKLPADTIVLSGYFGDYYEYFAKYLTISSKVKCLGKSDLNRQALIGFSHLIYKD